MPKASYYFVNALTWFRILAAPLLLILIFTDGFDIFKWLLAACFFTDLIDGYLARKFKVAAIAGAKLDSIGDDLTVLAAIIGLFVFKPEFVKEEFPVLIVVLAAFIIQTTLALIRYKKISSFHTYLAKTAAILQGLFFILAFLLSEPFTLLFYVAAIVTTIELIEETIIVLLLPEWKANVKGLYWVLKERAHRL